MIEMPKEKNKKGTTWINPENNNLGSKESQYTITTLSVGKKREKSA